MLTSCRSVLCVSNFRLWSGQLAKILAKLAISVWQSYLAWVFKVMLCCRSWINWLLPVAGKHSMGTVKKLYKSQEMQIMRLSRVYNLIIYNITKINILIHSIRLYGCYTLYKTYIGKGGGSKIFLRTPHWVRTPSTIANPPPLLFTNCMPVVCAINIVEAQ